MIYAQTASYSQLINPVAGSAAATYAPTFDTSGYDYALVIVSLGTSGTSATDNPSVLKIGEGTVTNVSSHTNVSGLLGDTDFTIPVAAAATNVMQVVLGINTKVRQRYLSLSMTLGAATNNSAVVILSKAETPATTAAGAGVNTLVFG